MPGKAADKQKNYRPIALFSICYKLLERIIFNRINTTINEHIPDKQAGFRTGRSCTGQTLALTTHIEAGFKKLLKMSVAFIELTTAYDTVKRQGSIFKFLKIIPCKKNCEVH